MRKVLITGASGFIGQACLPLLTARACEVHAVARRPFQAPHVHVHSVDLFDPIAVRTLLQSVRPTHLLHLAWQAAPALYRTSPENLDWVAASLGLTRAFHEQGGHRAVFAGSCAEYGSGAGWCDELATAPAPQTLYEHCKHALRTLVESYAGPAGLSVAWGRIFFVYGPGEHPDRLIASVIRSLLAGQPVRCSSGEQQRDFLHVNDVAAAFVSLLDSEVTGAVNIGSGEPVSVRWIVEYLAALVGRPDLPRFGERPADPQPLLAARGLRLRTLVGWQPQYTLREGLAAAAAWHRMVRSTDRLAA